MKVAKRKNQPPAGPPMKTTPPASAVVSNAEASRAAMPASQPIPESPQAPPHATGDTAPAIPGTAPASRTGSSARPTGSEVKWDRIAARAFALYIARGSREGRALDDWLEAESEILGEIETGKSS
ncbi:MAG: DUF2934 domain-containing protein [Nitrospiraceae bacterium]